MAEKKPQDQDLPPDADAPELDEVIREWQENGREANKPPQMILYKYEALTGTAYNHAGAWQGDEIPTKHEIGILFGSGRYWAIIKSSDKKRKPYSETFRLNPRYDELKADADAARKTARIAAERKELQLYGVPQQQQGMTTAEVFGLLKEFLGTITPLIKANQSAPIPAAPQQDFLGSAQILQKVMRANLMDTLQTYDLIKQKYLPSMSSDLTTESETMTEQPPKTAGTMILEKIISLVSPYFEKLAQATPEGKALGSMVQIAPDFNSIISNRELCTKIIKHYAQQAGIEKTKIAAQNIGFKPEIVDDALKGQEK